MMLTLSTEISRDVSTSLDMTRGLMSISLVLESERCPSRRRNRSPEKISRDVSTSLDMTRRIVERTGTDLLQADEYLARVGVKGMPEAPKE